MKKFLWQEKPIAVNSFNLTDVHKKYNIYQKCKFCCINCNIIIILQLRCIIRMHKNQCNNILGT